MSALAALVFRTAWARLRRDRGYTLFGLVALGVTGALAALSLGWLLEVHAQRLPYQQAENLWFLQIIDTRGPDLGLGQEMQASRRAVARFALNQTVFEELLVAEWARRPLGGGALPEEASRVGVLTVSDNFWRVLGVSPTLGDVPAEDAGRVVLGDAFARARFGAAHAALGQVVVVAGTPYTVAGVMSPEFPAPSELGAQRRGERTVDVFLPQRTAAADLSTAKDDVGRDLLVVGRSVQPATVLQQRATEAIGRLQAELGGTALRIDLRSLATHMLAAERKVVAAFTLVCLVLVVTALLALGLVTEGRFAARGQRRRVLDHLGGAGLGLLAFEVAEVGILLLLATAVALPLLAGGLFLLDHAVLTRGLVNGPFVLRAAGVWLVYTGVAGAFLLLIGLFGSRWASARRGGSNTRGGGTKRIGRGVLRVLLAAQTGLGLAVVSAVLIPLGDAVKTGQAVYANDYRRVTQLRLTYPAALPVALVAADLERLKRAVSDLPGVTRAAVSLGSALELIQELVAYRGPRVVRDELVRVNKDGSFVLRRRDDVPNTGPDDLSYRLSLVAVEPEFLAIMGYQLAAGRVFGDREEQAVVLSREAERALFAAKHDVVGEPIPAELRIHAEQLWHNQLSVAGVVQIGKVFDAVPGMAAFADLPVAFVPYRPAAFNADMPRRAYLMIEHGPDQTLAVDALQRLVDAGGAADVQAQVLALGPEVARRLQRHLMAATGTLFLGLAVIVAVGLGAFGVMLLIAEAQSGEIAIRLAVGAEPWRVAVRLIAGELWLPASLAVLWVLAGWFLQAALENVGIGGGQGGGVASVAAVLMLAALSLGFACGLLAPLTRSPMETLRAAEATG